MITILNYGLGNLGSIKNMLHFLEVDSKIGRKRRSPSISQTTYMERQK